MNGSPNRFSGAASAGPAAEIGWLGPGSRRSARRRLRWSRLLWALLYPDPRRRTALTIPGAVLIVLALAIGTAAYNTASNILFVTLSLMLACVILSGLISSSNFSRVAWRLELQPPLRAGREASAALVVRNGKRVLPTYALRFDLAASLSDDTRRFYLRDRLEPRGESRIDWTFRPARRGVETIALTSVSSTFPFGFLLKRLGGGASATVRVWPAQVPFRWRQAQLVRQPMPGERVNRYGAGMDLLALRKYQVGDSRRIIHWKATARMRQLMVRQFAAEARSGFFLLLETPGDRWEPGAQFELLCSFAGSLAEELFQKGRLAGVAVNDEDPMPVRRLADLEAFLDRLATVEPTPIPRSGSVPAGLAGITFSPEGTLGVCAYVDGQPAASA